ncbi:MAG: hypothetical protein J5525_01655 [Lachnospiraceae bacterium]|nr:hypothetical protein [Lachnospiraceae bacterium]
MKWMRKQKVNRIGLLLLSVLFILSFSACAKDVNSGETVESNGVSSAFMEAKDEIKQDEDLGNHIRPTDDIASGIYMTVINPATVRVTINDPYILAMATDRSQIQLKLYPDEEAQRTNSGAIAFKISFYDDSEKGMICSVYPQKCKIEQNDQGTMLTVDEEILDAQGAPLVTSGFVKDTSIVFAVRLSNVEKLVNDNRYYSAYVDYEVYTKGQLADVSRLKYIKPDFSNTDLDGKVDLSIFDEVYPSHFVIELDYDEYISYADHGWFWLVDDLSPIGKDLMWGPRKNKNITKKGLIIGSMDEYGLVNCYIVHIYDSHDDLLADYMLDENVNMTSEFGKTKEDERILTDTLFDRFYPDDYSNTYGSWKYTIFDNIICYKFITATDDHYSVFNDTQVPSIYCEVGGYITDGFDIDEYIETVLRDGSIQKKVDYEYYWDDVTNEMAGYQTAFSSIEVSGIYNSVEEATASSDDEKIKGKKDSIRAELDENKRKETEEKMNAKQTIDPKAFCTIYDNDSADILLNDIDLDALAKGDMYELDFNSYTIRLIMKGDEPACYIGRYKDDSFDSLSETPCYRNLDAGPNHITINASLYQIEEIGWEQVSTIEFYLTDKDSNRIKIGNVKINTQ